MRLQSSGQFVVALPATHAIGLFTPEGERAWVPGWDPTYPGGQPSEDSGAVFVTDSGGVETTWVILEIDRTGAKAAYARITPAHHAGIVRVACTDTPIGHSTVTVDYDMTLLSDDPAELDAHAEHNFDLMMQKWSDAVARCLDRSPT